MVAHHIARRAVEAITTLASDPDDREDIRVPPFAAFVFLLTCLAFGALLFCVSSLITVRSKMDFDNI